MTTFTIAEEAITSPTLLWDTTWDGFVGDWAPAAATEPSNRGGLRARAPLHTAILLCLMTDARAGEHDNITDGSNDPRGWAGDNLDTDLAPLGSKLWLLRRRELTQEVADMSVVYATQALQTLIDQGAVAEFKISAAPIFEEGRLELYVEAYKRSGDRVASMDFWLMWESKNVRNPLAA